MTGNHAAKEFFEENTLKSRSVELATHWNEVGNRIAVTVSGLCEDIFGNKLRAVVLTGSMARDEATIIHENGQWRVAGDAEFLLIFKDHVALPGEKTLVALGKSIEEILRSQEVLCPVTFSAGKAAYLRGLPPHIFGYELRECGRVVWGETSILSLIPSFSAAEIPLEDGWRLLSNRIVEHVENARSWNPGTQSFPPSLQYQTIKLCLDTATSFLLFAGAYAPTYIHRQQALGHILENASAKKRFPFLNENFAHEVDLCTQWKVAAEESGIRLNLGRPFWESVVSSACVVWRWELSILTGLDANAAFHELCKRSLRVQKAPQRARGWLLVFREAGWLHSWKCWPDWIGKVWQGSPRYRVYLAAFELFSRLEALLGNTKGSELNLNWTDIRDSLPVRETRQPESLRGDWRQLASEIAWNYHSFVEKTRA